MKDPRPLGPGTRRVVRLAECTLVWTLCAGLLIQTPAQLYAEDYRDPGIKREADRKAEGKLAIEEFLKTNILRSADDPVKQYLFELGTNELTNMGQVMYNMLSQTREKNRAGERAELTKQLDAMVINLRQAGAYSPTKHAEVARGLKDIQTRYGDLVGDVTKRTEESDVFSAHLRLNTMFDAMNEREQTQLGPSDVRLHKTDTGTYVYSKEGELLYKYNNNRVIIFNAALLKSQEAINTRLSQHGTFGMPPECPKRIRESGRYQHDLLLYSWCELKTKVDSIGKLKRRQRVIQMAALVGHQLSNDELNDDAKLTKLEAKLASEQITSGSWIPGWAAKAGLGIGIFGDDSFKRPPDFIDKKFVQYNKYLRELDGALETYKARINAFKGADTVTNEQLQQLKKQEFLVSRYMALTQMEALKVQTEFMLETLSYEAEIQKRPLKDGAGNPIIDSSTGKPKMVDAGVNCSAVDLSPDSLNYVKAVRTAGLSPEKQRQMFEQWHKMAKRFCRLTAVYNNVGTQLDYADVNSKLETPNRALRSAEAELQVLQRDYSNLMQMPQLMKFGHDQAGNGKFELTDLWHWTPAVTRFVADGLNTVSGGKEGWDIAGKYVRAREEIDLMSPKVGGIVDLLAQGKFRDAAVAVVDADAGAHATHLQIGLSTNYDDIKLTDKAAAVLAKYQENLGVVQKVHTYTGIPIDIVKWSVVLGGGSKLFSKMAKTGQFLVTGRTVAAGGELGAVRRGVGETLKQVRLRFDTLGPEFKTSFLKDTGYRMANAGVRITSFAAMIAPIGGSVTVLQHLYDGEKSQFGSVLEAAGQGSVHTMKWAAENPWILFVNIPYTAFSGTRFSGAAQSVANKGLIGNTWGAGVKTTQGAVNTFWRRPKAWLTGQTYTRATFADNVLARTALNGPGATKWLEGLAERGIAGRVTAGSLRIVRGGITNIDQVGKFWAVGQTAGYVGHHLGHNLRSLQWNQGPGLNEDGSEADGDWLYRNVTDRFVPRYEANQERRIKRAIQSGNHQAEGLWWLLLPMHPAQGSEVRDAMQNKIGVEQYLKSKDPALLLKLANAKPIDANNPTKLKFLHYENPPMFQRIMTMRFGRRLKTNEFHVSREAIEQATKRLLRDEVKEISGKDPHKSPWKYLEMLTIEDNQMLGRIRMREYTRNALVEQAEMAFKENPHHAKKILQKNPSEVYEGVTVGRPLLEDVALVVRHAAKLGGKNNPFATKAYKSTVLKAESILEPYFKSRQPRDAAAKALKTELDVLNKKGERSEALKQYLDRFSETVESWALTMKEAKTGAHYTKLLERAEAEISQTKGLNKGEVEAVKASIKYLRSIETRFNYFNNGESFVVRAGEAYDVAMNKAKDTPGSQRLQTEMGKMREKVDGFLRTEGYVEAEGGLRTGGRDSRLTAKGKDRARPLSENPVGGDKFTDLVGKLKGELKVLEADPTFGPGDAKIMKEFVQNVEGAPWLLRNSKGYNLQGWRPVQFESLTWFMRSLLEGNSHGQTLRVFLKLKTGGGKTLVATEGMWSFIEADAKAQGRTPVLLTPQENLVQQMEAELKATRNYGDIKVTTWSKLNAELAQRKVGSSGDKDATIKANSTKELYIVSDEYDAPFLAPATTIGQQLATISRVSEGLNIIRNTGKRMQGLLNDPHLKLKTHLDFYTQTMRVHAERLVEHPGHRKLVDRIARIDKAVVELHQLQSKPGLKGPARSAAIKNQLEGIRALVEGRAAKAGGPRTGGLTEMVEGMKIDKPWGKSGADALSKQIKAIEAEAVSLQGTKPADAAKSLGRGGKITKALELIETMVAKETGGIVSRSPSALSLRSETGRFRTRLTALEKHVSGQNRTLLEAAKSIKTQSAQVESLRVELGKQKYGTEAYKSAELKLKRAEVGLRRSVGSVRDILDVKGQRDLVEFSSRDGLESGNLRYESYALRRKLGALTAEVSPGKRVVAEITDAIVNHAGRQSSTLRNAAVREVKNIADIQTRILHSRPPENAHNLQQVGELGRELLATAKDPSKVKLGQSRKPNLLDRLRGRDSVRSEMEDIFSQQKQAMDYSRMDTRAQMKELLELSSKLRRVEAGPNAGKVEALANQIRDLNLQREMLRKDSRGTKAVDRQIKGLQAQKLKLSRTPLADEAANLAERLGKDPTAAQASRVDGMIEGLKVRLEGNARTQGLASQAQKIQAGLRVRDLVTQNTKDIRSELNTRREGWRERVNELVSQRNELFEKAVSKRNGVYETYQRMLDAMASDKFGFLSHQGTVHAEYLHMRKVLEAPESASKVLTRQSEAMLKSTRDVHRHYKNAHASAEAELASLKAGKGKSNAIEVAEAKVKEAKVRLDMARGARIDAQLNYRTTRLVAKRLLGLNDYAPEAKGEGAVKLKTMRAEMFRMVEEAAAKNLELSKLKVKKHAEGSAEAKKIKKLEGEVQGLRNRLEGFEKQIVQLNRQVAREALEQKLSEAESAEARAEFKEQAAKTPEGQALARRELTLARLEKRVAKMLTEVQVQGVKNASVEFQSLKQTRDATTARRTRLNEQLQKELDKKEATRDADKVQRIQEQLEWLNSIDKELGREIFQFQRKTALEIVDMAQSQAGSSAQKWRPKLDQFIGENIVGSAPTELVRLQTLRSELMSRRAEAGRGRKLIDVEVSVDAQLARADSPLRRLATDANGTVGKLADSAQGLNGKGLPKTVRDASVRFDKAVSEARSALDAKTDGYRQTNALKNTHGTAARLVSEMRTALQNPNLAKTQRSFLTEKIKAIEGRLEGVQTARGKLSTTMETIRNTANPNRGKSSLTPLDAEIAEVNAGIRALEGLRQPLRSMIGEAPQASRVHKSGKLTINNNQFDSMTHLKRAIEMDPARAKSIYDKKLNKLTRQFTNELTEAFQNEAFLAPEVRTQMFWNINGMWTWAKGLPVVGKYLARHHKSTWVKKELINMGTGHHNETADVRVDGLTKKVVPIHLGEWMPTMDIGTRRFWELKFKKGLTMPYEHQALVNMRNFVTDSPKLPIIGFSGTVGKVLQAQLQAKAGGFKIVGKGSPAFQNVQMQVVPTATARFQLIANSLVESLSNPDAKQITIVNHANSKDLKQMRRYLLRTGLVGEAEISMIFSDAVALGESVPKANVRKTMNLESISSGRTKIVLMDTRVAGRGLDLDWKGGKYKTVDVYFMDPHKISAVHELQAGGRVDMDRLLPGTKRKFSRVLDINSAQHDPVFMEAMLFNTEFRQIYYELMKNPPKAVRQNIQMRGGQPGDWRARHDWIMSLPHENPIRGAYNRLFTDYVKESQMKEEVDQLKSSRFLEGDGMNVPAHTPALHWAPKLIR